MPITHWKSINYTLILLQKPHLTITEYTPYYYKNHTLLLQNTHLTITEYTPYYYKIHTFTGLHNTHFHTITKTTLHTITKYTLSYYYKNHTITITKTTPRLYVYFFIKLFPILYLNLGIFDNALMFLSAKYQYIFAILLQKPHFVIFIFSLF